MPPIIAKTQTSIIRDKSNLDAWKSQSYANIRRNILVNGQISPLQIAPILSDSSSTLAKECAAKIAGHDASNLPFFSPFGNQGWVLTESLEDSRKSSPIEFQTDPARWTESNLLLPALYHHLQQLPSFRNVRSEAAVSFARDVMQFATSPYLKYLLTIPLSGIKVNSPITSPSGGAAFRQLTPREQGNFLSRWGIDTGNFGVATVPLTVLRLVISTGRHSQNPDVKEDASRWLCALYLNGYNPAGYRADLQGHPQWTFPGIMSMPLSLPPQPNTWASITPTRFHAICETVDRLHQYSISDPGSEHDLALHRFYSGASRVNHVDGVLDFVISLEALLLPYDEDARRGDLGYRFRVHGGHYLALKRSDRDKIARQLTDLYSLRSRLVHGGHYPTPSAIDEAWMAARTLAQRGLLRAVTTKFPTAADFKSTVLGI
jgi:Apea-like HEPN